MRDETRQTHRTMMARVFAHLDEHALASPGLAELAKVARLSPHHFHRLFKAYAGLPVAAYVRRRRLILAAAHLAEPGTSVLDAALEAGFSSHEAFTRAFTALFGLRPRDYKARAAAGAGRLPDPAPLPQPQGDPMDIEIKDLPAMRVACIRHVGPYGNCQSAWDELCAFGVSRGLFGPQTVFLGIGWDDPEQVAPEKQRYDACFTVGEDVSPEGPVTIREVGGGPHAVYVHRGPFDGLEAAYKALYAAIMAKNGLALTEFPPLEIYRTDPKTTPPEQLVTELCLPVCTRG